MRKKLRRRKCLKNAQTPQRQVHAVLGGVSKRTTLSLKKAFTAIQKKLLHAPLTISTDKNPDLPIH
jgi:hypothetical protein